MTAEQINEIVGIKEAYQLHDALENILFDSKKRGDIFEKLLSIEPDTSYDWFTDYFQQSQSDRKTMMQDYTPDGICKLVDALSGEHKTIFDCCAGIGGLTIPQVQKDRTIYCEELSENSLMLLLFNLSIRGAEGYVANGNCLKNDFKVVYKLTRSGKFSDIERTLCMDDFKADLVISNPPYSLKFPDQDQYKDDIRFREYGLPPKSKSDYAFILHGLHHMSRDGMAIFILPHGVLFRGQQEAVIRKKLIENNLLDAVIGLAENQFMNTGIPVCIMIFKKNRKSKNIAFIDASKQCEKIGKVNRMTLEHIRKISRAYSDRKEIEKFCHIAGIEEIQKNDFNLNIPRYVDTSEPVEPVNLYEVLKEIVELEKQQRETGRQLANMLRMLGGPEAYESQKEVLIDTITEPDSTLSDALRDIIEYLEKNKDALQRTRTINLMDVCKFERSRKGKIYSAGAITIQVFKMMRLTVHSDVNVQKNIVDILDRFEIFEGVKEKEIDRMKDVKKFHLDNMFC